MYEYKATVKRVIDGDSLVLDIDLGFYMFMNETKIRLYGLDTPEMNSVTKRKWRTLNEMTRCLLMRSGLYIEISRIKLKVS